MIMRIENGIKILEPGDKIRCKENICTIKEITFQEYHEGYGFIAEFRDMNGVYRNWKQEVDGGKAIAKED